ncbi:MAG TPA: MarR family transcriptional regulator [Gammaproteobacteria bacterium]
MKTRPAGERSGRRKAGDDLVARVGVAVRKMGAQSVITSRAVASRFGLHTTDLEVLDLIYLRGPVSAGELAAATGLTSGSVTALIDRLASAGYVERGLDPADRRRVLVRVRPAAVAPIERVYRGMQQRMFALWSTYGERELAAILDFLSRSTELAVECCAELEARGTRRGGRRPGDGERLSRAPSRAAAKRPR